jgi:hypothetical protein
MHRLIAACAQPLPIACRNALTRVIFRAEFLQCSMTKSSTFSSTLHRPRSAHALPEHVGPNERTNPTIVV